MIPNALTNVNKCNLNVKFFYCELCIIMILKTHISSVWQYEVGGECLSKL